MVSHPPGDNRQVQLDHVDAAASGTAWSNMPSVGSSQGSVRAASIVTIAYISPPAASHRQAPPQAPHLHCSQKALNAMNSAASPTRAN